jgi:hypothetical protein
MLERMIPLPEAGDYQVRIARKVREQERRNQREQLLARRLLRTGHTTIVHIGRVYVIYDTPTPNDRPELLRAGTFTSRTMMFHMLGVSKGQTFRQAVSHNLIG